MKPYKTYKMYKTYKIKRGGNITGNIYKVGTGFGNLANGVVNLVEGTVKVGVAPVIGNIRDVGEGLGNVGKGVLIDIPKGALNITDGAVNLPIGIGKTAVNYIHVEKPVSPSNGTFVPSIPRSTKKSYRKSSK